MPTAKAHARAVGAKHSIAVPMLPTTNPSGQYLYLPAAHGSAENAYSHHSFGDYVRAHDELRGWRRFLYPDQVIGK